MSKQTAMQELIKEMESLKTNKPYVNPQNALRDCISLAYLKLSMEKEQIVDAVNDSWNMAKHLNFADAQAVQYYNETHGGDK
jgi:hypothetical protein